MLADIWLASQLYNLYKKKLCFYLKYCLFIFFRKAQKIRENRAGITIQRYVRGWMCRRRFLKLRYSITGIQIYARGLLARRCFKNILNNFKITIVQRMCRGYLARQAFNKKLKMIVKCQATVRGFLARRLYKRMKVSYF